MAKKVVLAGACRTAIGKMGGALSNTPAADLGAIVIKEALRRANVKPEMVDEVKMGCVIQAAQGQNVARQAAKISNWYAGTFLIQPAFYVLSFSSSPNHNDCLYY